MAERLYTIDHFTGKLIIKADYKAPHANRPTPPRRHKGRKVVTEYKAYGGGRYASRGKLTKRLFA